jgi:DNA invertase Pin-like site-specific DNA recombinase
MTAKRARSTPKPAPAPTTKTVAYLRVSTEEQDLEKNKTDILKLAHQHRLGHVEFVEEKVSGKVSWKKRKLAEVLDSLTSGDNLIVSELSRLGRSMLECMEILSIATERGIHVYAVKGNWKLDGTLQSKIVAMAFSIAAEIERDLISSRTKEALRHRKASGLPMGRPKGSGKSRLDPHRTEIELFLKNGSTKTFIAKRYGVSKAALHNWLKKHSIKASVS